MVAAIGFIMIIVIVALLLKGKMSPIVVLVVVPAIAALILGHNPVAVADMIKEKGDILCPWKRSPLRTTRSAITSACSPWE